MKIEVELEVRKTVYVTVDTDEYEDIGAYHDDDSGDIGIEDETELRAAAEEEYEADNYDEVCGSGYYKVLDYKEV